MKRVVLVEDERALLRELTETFPWADENCRVIGTAGTFAGARAILTDETVDLVVTDIRLPDGNGLDLIAETAPPAAIVITGYHEIGFAQRALRAGAVDFLLKPLDDDELRSAVQRAVRRCSETVGEARSSYPLIDSVPAKNPLVVKALSFIEMHYRSDVSLNEAAEQLGITEGHLAGVFKAETGNTFVQALTAYRMNAASSLLKDYRLNVTEVSQRCGYKDPAYFAKVFRKHFGMSPGSYRKRV